jgi:hypothetical protein
LTVSIETRSVAAGTGPHGRGGRLVADHAPLAAFGVIVQRPAGRFGVARGDDLENLPVFCDRVRQGLFLAEIAAPGQ